MSEVFNADVLDAINRALSAENVVTREGEEPVYCNVNNETREIEIPGEITIFGVEHDENAVRVFFKCPKIIGDNIDIDITQSMVYIIYINAGGEKDQYIVTDVNETEDDNVTFSWLINRKPAKYQGITQFGIRVIKSKTGGEIENEWNTTVANANILNGVETEDIELSGDNIDVVNQLLDLTKQEIELKKQNSIEEIEQKGQETLTTIPDDYTTAAQNALSAKNEVEDIRVGADGTTYTNAGTAIRKNDELALQHSQFNIPSNYDFKELDPRRSYLIWKESATTLLSIDEKVREILMKESHAYISQAIWSTNVSAYKDLTYSVFVLIYCADGFFIICDYNTTELKYIGTYNPYSLDETLTISGSVAESKTVGDLLLPINYTQDLCTNAFVYGGYIDVINGNLVEELIDTFVATDYIYILDNVISLLIQTNFLYEEGIAFYDENKQFMDGYNRLSEEFQNYENDVFVVINKKNEWKYVRITAQVTKKNSTHIYTKIDDSVQINTYSENVIVRRDLEGTSRCTTWINVDNRMTFLKNSIKIVIPKDTYSNGNIGFKTDTFTLNENNMNNIIVYLDLNVIVGEITLFIAGKHKNDNNTDVYEILSIYNEGAYKGTYIVDLAYIDVHTDIDTNLDMYFIMSVEMQSEQNVIVNTCNYEFDKYQGSSLPGETLVQTIINVQKELDKKADIDSIPPSDVANNILTSPDGNKFIPLISDNGIVTYTPIIPNKTLFIGNSLLIGWGTFGMCAKDSLHDYYHYVSSYVKNIKESATFDKIDGVGFETSDSEEEAREWMNTVLSEKLSNDIELVVIQLSDNTPVNEESINVFKNTCIELIKYIRGECVNARVVWVGAWYYTSEKISIIQKACSDTGTLFINITDLNVPNNQGSIGDEIHRDDGSTTTVDSSGVASHPGNKGMRLIANRILYRLGMTDVEEYYNSDFDGE